MAFDTERHAPRWVAYPMHTWYWTPRATGRTDTWDWDPTLPRDVQPDIVTNGSYWQGAPDGPFSRGHMLASADRLRSVPMNTQTFYITNLAPQVNDDFNDTVWADLEFAVRDWSGFSIDTLYCVTGLAYELVNGKERVTYDKRTPRMEVKVPSHFYKVLLQRKDRTTKTPISELSASELRCIGFWFENRAHDENARFEDAVMKVSDIEKRVGLEFFPLLSDEAESIKGTLNLADWGLD
jgi:DNA/RNA endonuclease G (NUC1)